MLTPHRLPSKAVVVARRIRAVTALTGMIVVLVGIIGACGSDSAESGDTRAPGGITLEPGLIDDTPGRSWTRVDPDRNRWDPERLERALATADSVGSGALVVVDGGAIVAHGGAIAEAYQVASVRKSLLSILLGIAVDRGQLDLDATLAELEIDDVAPSLTPTEKTATVRDLLTARSGVYHVAAYEPAAMRARRPARASHAPGEFWFYNNWDFNALGTIYERATGVDVFEGFRREIAGPLGLENFDPDGQQWVDHPNSRHPAYVFRMSAQDLARVGLLMARDGMWSDRRIVSRSWVATSTSPVVPEVSWGSGYGYMWWVPVDGRHYEGVTIPDGSFIARGNGPHHMLVVPEQDLIIVHMAETNHPNPSRWVSVEDVAEIFDRVLRARRPPGMP